MVAEQHPVRAADPPPRESASKKKEGREDSEQEGQREERRLADGQHRTAISISRWFGRARVSYYPRLSAMDRANTLASSPSRSRAQSAS